MDDHRQREAEFADAVLDLMKAFEGFEAFRETEDRFRTVEQTVDAVSYTFHRLSMARRKMQENLANSRERR